MEQSNQALQSTRGFNCIFIHSSLDDANLTPHQFRLYAHLSRRAGDGSCWSGAEDMAKVCCMKRDTVFKCFKELEARNMIQKIKRPGATNLWRLMPPEVWDKAKEQPRVDLSPETGRVKYGPVPQKGTGPVPRNGTTLSPETGHEGDPRRVSREGDPKAVPVPPNLSSPEFLQWWHDWLDERKQRKQPVTERAAKIQLAMLGGLGLPAAIQSIKNSISCGWQGLFPLKPGASAPNGKPRPCFTAPPGSGNF